MLPSWTMNSRLLMAGSMLCLLLYSHPSRADSALKNYMSIKQLYYYCEPVRIEGGKRKNEDFWEVNFCQGYLAAITESMRYNCHMRETSHGPRDAPAMDPDIAISPIEMSKIFLDWVDQQQDQWEELALTQAAVPFQLAYPCRF
jgi:hypothetical protein